MKKTIKLIAVLLFLNITLKAQSWEAVTMPFKSCVIPIESAHVYAKGDKMILIQDDAQVVYLSLDKAQTWTKLVKPGFGAYAVTEYKNKIYLAVLGSCQTSADNGKTWTKTIGPNTNINHFLEYNGALYAGSDSKGLLKLDETTNTWSSIAFTGKDVKWLGQSQGIFFAKQSTLYYSTDAGINWTATNTTGGNITGLATVGNTMMLSSYFSNFSISTDKGMNWQVTNDESHSVTSIDGVFYGALAVSSTNGKGVFKYNLNNGTWEDFTAGIADLKKTYAVFNNQNGELFAMCDVATMPGSIDLRLYKIKVGKGVADKMPTLTENQVSIFPNPTTNEIHIKLNRVEPMSYELMDMQGNQFAKQKLTLTDTQIDLANIQSGVYTLKIVCKEGIRIEKIIKQ